MTSKHNHYFKDVSHLDKIDVYRIIELYKITDPCLQHALKKLLVAGGRGNKDMSKDVQEVIDSCVRWQEMRSEEAVVIIAGDVNIKIEIPNRCRRCGTHVTGDTHCKTCIIPEIPNKCYQCDNNAVSGKTLCNPCMLYGGPIPLED